jgi:hypothetical protein
MAKFKTDLESDGEAATDRGRSQEKFLTSFCPLRVQNIDNM